MHKRRPKNHWKKTRLSRNALARAHRLFLRAQLKTFLTGVAMFKVTGPSPKSLHTTEWVMFHSQLLELFHGDQYDEDDAKELLLRLERAARHFLVDQHPNRIFNKPTGEFRSVMTTILVAVVDVIAEFKETSFETLLQETFDTIQSVFLSDCARGVPRAPRRKFGGDEETPFAWLRDNAFWKNNKSRQRIKWLREVGRAPLMSTLTGNGCKQLRVLVKQIVSKAKEKQVSCVPHLLRLRVCPS